MLRGRNSHFEGIVARVAQRPEAEARPERGTLLDRPETIELGASDRTAGRERVTKPGDAIEQYALLAVIGSGGMGTVYRAHDGALGRDVALKLIHEDMLESRRARDAFVAEARAMACVRHPNVVTIHALGEHRGRPFLVMEYVSGTSLATWRSNHPSATLAERIRILDHLCLGVAAIHEAGAVHRDIKPGNVLIDDNGRVAVTDFGLASLASPSGDGRPFAFGTPAYMAPEIARDDAIDPMLAARIDTYGIGVVAFELLTGQRPFPVETLTGMLHEHAHTEAPKPSRMAPELSAAFDDVLLRALAKAPQERTASAASLRRELLLAHEVAREFPDGLKILVVDDETSSIFGLRELLLSTFPGAEVIGVTNTTTAAAIAISERPDLVITDLRMPDGGAPRLTAMLRNHPHTVSTPIIVVTGQGGASEWRELRALGADRFLVKPIDFEALVTMIRSTLRPRETATTSRM